MNNPFRHRSPDDHDPRRASGRGWDEDFDARFDEGRSWREEARYGLDRSHDRPLFERYGRSHGAGRWAGDHPDQNASVPWRQGAAGRDTMRGATYPEHAYAPGSQIWDASGTGVDYYGARGWSSHAPEFEPDYLHWRNEQIARFDNDYRSWRDEKRQKFSLDFHNWRQARPQAEPHNAAANPIVGEITDGGEGRKHRDKI